MPTLQFTQCLRPRSLALLALSLAQLTAPAFADVSVEVHGVDEEISDNVLAYLSMERYKESDDLTAEVVERLHERIEREVRAAMRPFGFYEPTVISSVKRDGDADDSDWFVDINIAPGRPVMIQNVDVKVTGPGADDEKFTTITADLPLQPGQRLDHASYDSLKGNLLRTAATFGYLDARMIRNEMRVDPQSYTADVAIEFETGPLYFFGATTVTQDVIDDVLLRRFIRYAQDERFNATELLRTQFALDDSLYFSTVEVLPEEPDREQHLVPVKIVAEANRRHRFSYGIGYGTDTDIRGTVAWEDRRVNRRGHRFRSEIRAAALEQSLDARYIVPIGDPATERFTLQLSSQLERLADVDTRSTNFEPSITHLRSVFGRDWQRVLYTTLKRTTSEFTQSERTDTQTLLIPGVSFSLVPRGWLGEALFSRVLYAELRGSHNSLGSDSDFLQVHVQAERVFHIGDDADAKWHVVTRAEVGASAVARASRLAVSERFFAGGDRSVRGFDFNDLSPVEPTINEDGETVLEKVGGRHVVTASFELVRDLPRNFAIAVFTDVGNAFDTFGDRLEYSAGIGLRFRLPVVSVGIDIAQALSTPVWADQRPGPRLHLNFSPKL